MLGMQECDQSLQRFSQWDSQRSSLPLSKKYVAVCEVSNCLAYNRKQSSQYNACTDLAAQRIIQEDQYVQAVIIHQEQQALSTTFNAYARGYLNQHRLDALLEKIVMMAKGMGFVDNKVPELTRMCSA